MKPVAHVVAAAAWTAASGWFVRGELVTWCDRMLGVEPVSFGQERCVCGEKLERE